MKKILEIVALKIAVLVGLYFLLFCIYVLVQRLGKISNELKTYILTFGNWLQHNKPVFEYKGILIKSPVLVGQ